MPKIPDILSPKYQAHMNKIRAEMPAKQAAERAKIFMRCGHSRREHQRDGFGLAGGGYGMYIYCKECGEIDEKFQDMEEEMTND